MAKKIFFITCSFLFLLLSAKQVRAQYVTSGGVRVGGTTGYTVKQFVHPDIAVEGIFGTFGNGYSLTGLIEKYVPVFDTPGLYVFFGAGFHVAAYNGKGIYNSNFGREVNYPRNDLGLGIDAIAGLEYKINRIPLAFALDFKPFIEFGPGGRTAFAPDPSIGIRYVFR